jgi:uncharacterized protein YggE
VDQVGFDVADKTDLVVQAREAAFADARERAEHLARLAERTLGRLESVEESPLHGPVSLSLAHARKLGPVPLGFGVEPGRQTVELALTVQWSWA